MFVNVSPTFASSQETLCSLRFANQVSQIELGKAQKHVQVIQQVPAPPPAVALACASAAASESCTNPTPLKQAPSFSKRSSMGGGLMPMRLPGSSSHAMNMFASVAKDNKAELPPPPAPSAEPVLSLKARPIDFKRNYSSTVTAGHSSILPGKEPLQSWQTSQSQLALKKAKPSATGSYDKPQAGQSKSSSWR